MCNLIAFAFGEEIGRDELWDDDEIRAASDGKGRLRWQWMRDKAINVGSSMLCMWLCSVQFSVFFGEEQTAILYYLIA